MKYVNKTKENENEFKCYVVQHISIFIDHR